MNLSYVSLFSVLALGCPACVDGEFPTVAGPGPSGLVTARETTLAEIAALAKEVQRSGPSAEVAALGALCTGGAAYTRASYAVGDFGAMLGGEGAGPKILLYGYYADDGNALAWAAYVLDSFPAMTHEGGDYAGAALMQWPDAHPVAAELAIVTARPNTCGTTLDGIGTFHVGGVTVTCHVEVVQGC